MRHGYRWIATTADARAVVGPGRVRSRTSGRHAPRADIGAFLSDDEDEAELGRGTFGKTYRMLHDDGSLRAVKVINVATAEKKGVSIAKLEAEASNMELLRHENIVAYYGKLYTGSKKNPKKFFWIVMELVEGDTLFGRIGSDLSAATLVGWLLQIGKALAYMHSAYLVHRDMKPANLLLNAECLMKVRVASRGCGCQRTPPVGLTPPRTAGRRSRDAAAAVTG